MSLTDMLFLGVIALLGFGYLYDIGKALRRIADALERYNANH
jgi:hypothetical protein